MGAYAGFCLDGGVKKKGDRDADGRLFPEGGTRNQRSGANEFFRKDGPRASGKTSAKVSR